MIHDHDERYPFPGAKTMFESPIPLNSFEPKAWGIGDMFAPGGSILFDAEALFQTNGVIVGDPLFLCSSNPMYHVATTVGGVIGETSILVNWLNPDTLTDVLYKVGEAAQHTFQSLLEILIDRGTSNYTLHWRRCWTNERYPAFRPDELGDIYIIDPEEERKHGGKNNVNGIREIRPEVQ